MSSPCGDSPRSAAGSRELTVKDLLKLKGRIFGLRLIPGTGKLVRAVTVSEINRPGLAIAGHMEQFRSERIQIIGQGEYAYCLKAPAREVEANLTRMFGNADGKGRHSPQSVARVPRAPRPAIPCVIVTGGLKPLEVIRKACRKAGIPLLTTTFDTSTFIRELTMFLDDKLAAVAHVHGVLVSVYGLGVLIQGDSGVGKSECALELLKRGHIMIADDVVEIKRRIGYMLVGRSPRNIQHYMEVRGLGIIDVELLFGVGSILDQSMVEMHVKLESVAGGIHTQGYDRTGLENTEISILDVPVPSLRLPVTPGRNLAVLIEVAALNQRLKNQGYFVAKKFNESLMREMNPGRGRVKSGKDGK
ncbi:MAG: HPr kinase/phosphorylase [Elusimicrobia bacterium]|nr:MAG: HPr kinase/phosphorylase [Elusimicrobiota bacterium]KAF0157671.1 MAG: HPr kinase/phosphorylase [Elusimicrobiota bacterium]